MKKEDLYKIIIAGSRSFNDLEMMYMTCDYYFKDRYPDIEIISGHAKGADKFGEKYAKENDLKLTIFKADWSKYGKSAGYRRNVEMGNYADAGIIFWDGISKGSMHMVNILKGLDKPYRLIRR
jgi:hypothetical protein